MSIRGNHTNCKYVAKCLGWKHGTNCTRTMKSPKSKNMREDQLCFECAQEVMPEKYGEAQGHGKGGKFGRNLHHHDFNTMPEKPIIQVAVK